MSHLGVIKVQSLTQAFQRLVGSINEDRRREARMQGEAKVVYDFKY